MAQIPAKLINKNKKAYFNYEIGDTYIAGVSLTGAEAKSASSGGMSLDDSFVRILEGEAFLWNANIIKYKYATMEDYDPTRTRRLLLRKREIYEMESKARQKNMTIVPLKVLLSHGKIKIEIGLAKGKKTHQKLESVKKRELDRELHREKKKHGLI